MVASPEVCRMNGAKSKGATTPRGKTIARRNATKHGLLAKQPPLLVTEDLATFEGLVQGLIDQYQPDGPVEHFLIQQVAMGMLKQHRLWSVEAAIANLEILKAQRLVKFPDQVVPAKINLSEFDEDYRETRTPLKSLLERELDGLEMFVINLDFHSSRVQEIGEAQTLAAFHRTINERPYRLDPNFPVWEYQEEVQDWLHEAWDAEQQRYGVEFQEAIAWVKQLVALAQQRMESIHRTIEEIEATDRGIQEAEIAINGMQQPELFGRYQRAINRELYEALDRLEAMQERKHGGSMGSFGQKVTALPAR
jgi:hypothetical protein